MQKAKKWIAIISGSLGAILLILLIIGWTVMPGERTAQVKVKIDVAPLSLFPYFSDMRQWPNWTVWNDTEDPTLKSEFAGPVAAVGHTWRWTGVDMGAGAMTITSLQEGRMLQYELDFEGMDPSAGQLDLRMVGEATEVTWTHPMDLGLNPIARLFGYFIQSSLESDFEGSLERLKAKAEAN